MGFYVYRLLVLFLPETRLFWFKRMLLRKLCRANIGKNVRICSSARFQISGKLTILDNTWIGENALVTGGSVDVTIGLNVDIGPNVLIVTGKHELWGLENKAAGKSYSEPIVIKDGVWIGASSTILGGVTVKENTMIAAGAVVVKSTEANSVYGGVPARQIKKKRIPWV